jgi:integrase
MQSKGNQQPRRTKVAKHPGVFRSSSGKYEISYRDNDGKQHFETIDGLLADADAKLAEIRSTKRGGGTVPKPSKQTLRQFVNEHYFPSIEAKADAGVRSVRGVEYYRFRWAVIERQFGGRQMSKVTTADVLALIADLRRRGMSEWTIAGTLTVLSSIYSLGRALGVVGYSPLDGLRTDDRPKPSKNTDRVLDEHELELICRHAPANHRAVVTVLAYTGLRLSEALGLRWQDVDFVESEIAVAGQLLPATRDRAARHIPRGKSDASLRHMPMFPAVEKTLTDHLQAEMRDGRGQPDAFVFCTRTGKPLSAANVRERGVVKAGENAGLGRITPQDLRRSVCSLMGRRGVDPVEGAQMTGHTLAVWQEHYATSYGKQQRDEARARMLEHGFGA